VCVCVCVCIRMCVHACAVHSSFCALDMLEDLRCVNHSHSSCCGEGVGEGKRLLIPARS